MRIAAGLPEVRPYVIPSFAINSMALVEADGTPAVAVTEGLLADCTRDEMQAVADALSLLANIVMAWNTAQMQTIVDRWNNRRAQSIRPEIIPS